MIKTVKIELRHFGSEKSTSNYLKSRKLFSKLNDTVVQELASLGLDRLKSALMALGLKCGGTLEARAERLFSTKARAHRCFYSHSVVLMTAQSLVYILESNCFENLPTFKFIADNSLTLSVFKGFLRLKQAYCLFTM